MFSNIVKERSQADNGQVRAKWFGHFYRSRHQPLMAAKDTLEGGFWNGLFIARIIFIARF